MSGLNFQTQTIINENLDRDSLNDAGEAKVLFGVLSETGLMPDEDGYATDTKSNIIKIRREFEFDKNRITTVFHKPGNEPKCAKLEFDFTAATLNSLVKPTERRFARLSLQLGVRGAEPFIMSSLWIEKGLPFWVQFTIEPDDDATAIANNIVSLIKKGHIFQKDRDLIRTKADAGILTLTAVDEYCFFREAEISTFEIDGEYNNPISKITYRDADSRGTEIDNGKGIKITPNLVGFGTYKHIVKDLRLPTIENVQPWHIRQSETPVLGALYDQFIIYYRHPAQYRGIGAVGQPLELTTIHVFWVKSDVVDAFKNLFDAGSITEVTANKADTKDPNTGRKIAGKNIRKPANNDIY